MMTQVFRIQQNFYFLSGIENSSFVLFRKKMWTSATPEVEGFTRWGFQLSSRLWLLSSLEWSTPGHHP